ncbi:single insulin-like growth factor-binding domain protein-2 [Panulirus ornatus]|uniref:single insulin-like growth factor-binding domain protein-2 n=1 Tax=Panulirus ornatus TaxID=150431 RepID=UPI003A837CD3
MRGTALLLLTSLAILHMSVGLSCLPCDMRKCVMIYCPYGTELDICHCCHRCLKGPGEQCGGDWYMKGNCAKGMVCKKDPSLPRELQYLNVGICVKITDLKETSS